MFSAYLLESLKLLNKEANLSVRNSSNSKKSLHNLVDYPQINPNLKNKNEKNNERKIERMTNLLIQAARDQTEYSESFENTLDLYDL